MLQVLPSSTTISVVGLQLSSHIWVQRMEVPLSMFGEKTLWTLVNTHLALSEQNLSWLKFTLEIISLAKLHPLM